MVQFVASLLLSQAKFFPSVVQNAGFRPFDKYEEKNIETIDPNHSKDKHWANESARLRDILVQVKSKHKAIEYEQKDWI